MREREINLFLNKNTEQWQYEVEGEMIKLYGDIFLLSYNNWFVIYGEKGIKRPF